MKKNEILVGTFIIMQFMAKAQVKKDSTYRQTDKTDIEVVYNQYIQDGDNSAITGGVGTEKLIVYGPALSFKKTKGNKTYGLKGGVDVISSASTDNIDFIKSSASELDARTHVQVNYGNKLEKKNISINGGGGFSIESDYFSIRGEAGFVKEDKLKTKKFSLQFQVFRDDLRWGRLDPGNYRPIKLIYPQELRTQEWYNVNLRHSYNLKLGFTRIINRRNIIGTFFDLTHQSGLLATPFHRVYFTDGSVAVEQLPRKRWKGAFSFRLNSFVGGRVILKNAIEPYIDNFGITALALENETAIKITPELVLLGNLRFLAQSGARYFKDFEKHTKDAKYFTSDFDLSTFQSYSIGTGIKKNFDKNLIWRLFMRSFSFRYNFYYRSNGLHAHIMSLSTSIEHNKNRKRRKKGA